ncbi:hypothetical protein ABK905_06200 [Acerihabitans sp. KWT182]|uniref:Uncharacterized protein n=1 Tax=Acerihabitans sp. KWT182 TaxID=3157919 RepID=A0AAU7QEF1_9GAMM
MPRLQPCKRGASGKGAASVGFPRRIGNPVVIYDDRAGSPLIDTYDDIPATRPVIGPRRCIHPGFPAFTGNNPTDGMENASVAGMRKTSRLTVIRFSWRRGL